MNCLFQSRLARVVIAILSYSLATLLVAHLATWKLRLERTYRMLRFRIFRKCWLGACCNWLPYGRADGCPNSPLFVVREKKAITALASALCIVLSLSFYRDYDPKSDMCVLIAVPGLCLVVSVTACASLPNLPSVYRSNFHVLHIVVWQNK